MSPDDDVPFEMPRHEMDDAAAERLLRGSGSPAAEQEPLARLLGQVRAMSASAPEPSAALAALLRDGFPPAVTGAPAAAPQGARWGRRLAAAAGLSLGMKVLTGTGVALAAVGTAAGAGVLPEPVADRVGSIVRTLTPFDGERDREPAPPVEAPVSPTATTPTLPSPAPLEQPARGTAPQDLPTPPPAAGSRPVPAPEPAAPRSQQRPPAPASESRAPQSRPGPARPEPAPAEEQEQEEERAEQEPEDGRGPAAPTARPAPEQAPGSASLTRPTPRG